MLKNGAAMAPYGVVFRIEQTFVWVFSQVSIRHGDAMSLSLRIAILVC
ncbi:MAG: hypothetical protein ACLTW9_29970 [Enterocloster sp.]